MTPQKPARKKKPRPLPTKKEREAAKVEFPDATGVPCVDPDSMAFRGGVTGDGTYYWDDATQLYCRAIPLEPSWTFPADWRETRYRMAERLTKLARAIRRLAWKVAP